MIEVRLSPQGWIAQLVPSEAIAEEAYATGKRWLCMSWPDGTTVRADLLTDGEVVDWRTIHRDEERTPGGSDVR